MLPSPSDPPAAGPRPDRAPAGEGGLFARLHFDRGDRRLLALVDEVLAKPSTSLRRLLAPYMHPHGIKEMAAPPAMRIAYATARLLGSLEAGQAEARLSALRSLRDEVLFSAESGLQKNTARVLLQIMKELVRAGDDPRRRLELAHDFRTAVRGKPRLIRRLLAERHLLEMPEAWNQLAFDDHVHDANSKGRKSPTHLVMDAWIKGIRRLTVVHYHAVRQDTAAELLEAAAIMGMEADIAIECLTRHDGRPVKVLWTPAGLGEPWRFAAFLGRPNVRRFMDEGRELALRWRDHALALLAAVNDRHAPKLRAELGLSLPHLTPEAFLAFVGTGQPSVLHLARFLHDEASRVLDAEGLDLGDEAARRAHLARRDAVEVEALLAGILSPAANPDIRPPNAPAPDETPPERLTQSPAALVRRLGHLHRDNRLTLVATEMAPADLLTVLFSCHGAITHLELFNLRVFEVEGRASEDALELLAALGAGDVSAVKRQLVAAASQATAAGDTAAAARLLELRQEAAPLCAIYRHAPLGVRLGSDSAGRSTRTRGMGLVVADTLPAGARAHLAKRARHPRESLRRAIPVGVAVTPRETALADAFTPGPLTRLLRRLRELPGLRLSGHRWRRTWIWRRTYKADARTANIHTLGGVQETASERLTVEAGRRRARLRWRYVNGTFKNALKILAGFAVAAASFASVNTWWVLAYGGAFIWFGVTGLRNLLQAAVGCGGLRHSPLVVWKDYVSAERIADSLFFTGFSGPLLDILVRLALLERGFGITTATNPLALYAVMALANGLYLASHNLYRGLPTAAAVGNLVRPILSIPLAFGLNQALAAALAGAGVASPEAALEPFAAIVSKCASDCVAAAIEGLADRARYRRMRIRDYRHKCRQLFEAHAQLDRAYPDADATRLLETPKALIASLRERRGDLEKIVIVNALDFLYFWMHQPQARPVAARTVRAMTLEERRVFLLSQDVLLREKEISRLLIDGLVGRNFAPALAFYLSNARRYLDDMRELAQRYPPAASLSLENTLPGRHEAPELP
ncbi:hypothetical protein [Solidesulfovibrio sp.]|uniref:hypothetical protein n=1 Tax=Solidesulfovibrio sp. TaxID=2910990 RepID=UPI002B219285|nr:hypothetical protein [Solidesulfovibrio sp.]MEA4857757.1 hypothetical protein [Solidesulfovibrio sp.]